MKFGLKLWSTNEALAGEARRLHREKIYDFLEIYVVPGTASETAPLWKELDIPVVVHAPHFRHGCNLSLPEQFEANKKLLKEAEEFCHFLNAKHVIVHLGTKGYLEESLRQLRQMGLKKIVVENKPEVALDGSHCVGTSPQDFKKVLRQRDVGFCLDIAHAACYAAFHKLKVLDVWKKFVRLKPVQYHFSDGFLDHVRDCHASVGAGEFDFGALSSLLPRGSWITLETPKKSPTNLDDFILDVARLKQIGYGN